MKRNKVSAAYDKAKYMAQAATQGTAVTASRRLMAQPSLRAT